MDYMGTMATAFMVIAALVGGAAAGADDGAAPAEGWKVPVVALQHPAKHPVVACTPAELAHLRAVWAAAGADHDCLAARFAKADAAMKKPLEFPPEGSQHNEWYQCDKCQSPLETIDAHHHKCPVCGTVYSGFPYDNVLYGKQHDYNISRAEDAAWAWAVTGKKEYAEFAAKVLLGYAERYLKYPMVSAFVNDKSIDIGKEKLTKYKTAGHINDQTLGEAMQMMPIATTYDLIYDSGALSDEQKKQVETKFIRPMIECIDVYRAGKSNWQSWHNAALLWAGAVLGDEALVKQSLFEPANGFLFQMANCVSSEGMWYENSWAYHYYTLYAMGLHAEGARRLGLDLYSNPTLKKMYLLAFDYQMSDGSIPRFGDGLKESPHVSWVNEIPYAIYHDNRILSGLPDKPTFDSVLLGRDATKKAATVLPTASKLFPGGGHAILRTDGPGKLSAAMIFGPNGGFHTHLDRLSFVFFGYGQELAVDPGRAASQAYRLPIHGQWYKGTTGHNAVLVDGQGQVPADGQFLAFAANASYAAAAADAGTAFANVRQRRFLLLAPTYLLGVDELKATDGKEHTFDWLYHNFGTKVACDLPAGKGTLGETPGYAYLKDVAAFGLDKDGPLHVTFTDEKVTTHLTMLGQAGDQVFTGNGPLKTMDDRVPMTIVRRKGTTVRFFTVIAPVPQGSDAAVPSLSLTSGRPLTVNVKCGTVEDNVSFLGDELGKFSVWRQAKDSGVNTMLKSDN
jgi:hypothetical protein